MSELVSKTAFIPNDRSVRSKQVLSQFLMFVGPALLFFSVFFFYPLVNSIIISFHEWNGISNRREFIGLGNYVRLLSDDGFRQTVGVTIIFATTYVVTVNVLAFSYALVLDPQRIVGSKIHRALVFMPNAISLVIVAFIWRAMFSRVIPEIGEFLGLEFLMISWFRDQGPALATIIISFVWQTVGYYMTIYFAGLQMIGSEYYESADMDGANGWTKLTRITIPLMMQTFTVTFFLSTATAFKVFSVVFAMTQGGPGGSTETMAVNVYFEAFQASNFGYASAKAIFLLLCVMLVSFAQVRYTKRREVEL